MTTLAAIFGTMADLTLPAYAIAILGGFLVGALSSRYVTYPRIQLWHYAVALGFGILLVILFPSALVLAFGAGYIAATYVVKPRNALKQN